MSITNSGLYECPSIILVYMNIDYNF
ncbi:unnamed protein product, partial [Rotaria sp. Silwood1]